MVSCTCEIVSTGRLFAATFSWAAKSGPQGKKDTMSDIDIAATWSLVRLAGACITIFGVGLLGVAVVVHVGDWWYRRKYGEDPRE
jgi:hypothetical protein